MDAASPTEAGPLKSPTLGELKSWHATYDAKARTGDVEQRFIADRDLPACIIRDGTTLLGVLSRKSLMAELSRHLGRDIYIKRPVLLLASVIDTCPMVLPAATTVEMGVKAALSRPGEHAYEPVLVESDGELAIVEVDLLMRVQSRLLESAVAAKDALIEEVRRTANELRTALGNLEQARDRLVQSEKMAALGQLVAGIAHEINTPIGVALTAATHLGERTSEFIRAFSENKMQRSDLQVYTELARESSGLLHYNIQRAAQLIQSFKQVAADQASEQHRAFELRSYLEQLIASLAPEVRKAGHALTWRAKAVSSCTATPARWRKCCRTSSRTPWSMATIRVTPASSRCPRNQPGLTSC